MVISMEYYKIVLESLQYFLECTGVKFWDEWIKKDIFLWEKEKRVDHHLQAFGGMGSLNDVWICKHNGHAIADWQEPWANTLLKELKDLSILLAISAREEKHPAFNEIKKKYSMKPQGHIQGTRCLACGFSALDAYNIDSYISSKLISEELLIGLANNQLRASILKCLNAELAEIQIERNRIKEIMRRSAIQYTEHQMFMRPCKQCESEDTAVYRWIEVVHGIPFARNRHRFIPSEDNLQLRTK